MEALLYERGKKSMPKTGVWRATHFSTLKAFKAVSKVEGYAVLQVMMIYPLESRSSEILLRDFETDACRFTITVVCHRSGS